MILTSFFFLEFHAASKFPGHAPEISKETPQDKVVRLGGNVTFECREKNRLSYHPKIEWLKWNQTLSARNTELDFENGSFTVIEDTVGKYKHHNVIEQKTIPEIGHKYTEINLKLMIINITEDDLGMYTCVACDKHGRSHRSAFLRNIRSVHSASTQTFDVTTIFNTTTAASLVSNTTGTNITLFIAKMLIGYTKGRLTLERPREGEGVKWTPIGFSDLTFEAFKQSK